MNGNENGKGTEKENERTRVTVRVAGRILTVLTDEDPEAVREIEKKLESRIEELARLSPRMATRDGKFDAVILCAIDAVNRENAAQRRAEEQEKRADELDRKYKALLDEYAALTYSRTRMTSAGDSDGPGDGASREETIAKIREILIRIRDRDRQGTEGGA